MKAENGLTNRNDEYGILRAGAGHKYEKHYKSNA